MRAVAGAILSGIGVLLVFSLWLRYPIQLSIAIGAIFIVMFLMVAAAIGAKPEKADAAWRVAAADLVGRPPDNDLDVRPDPSSRTRE
jgi:hypothetical protein